MVDHEQLRHPDLDLKGRIRPGLDILANVIVIGLKTRCRYPRNAPVYEPGLVRSDPATTLLAYELARIERCHAELGRYTFATQDAFSDVSAVEPIISREPPESPIVKMTAGVGDRIIDFYRSWIDRFCTPGTDSDCYGETVTSDVDVLLAIMERVNLGKLVAESKYLEKKDAFIATDGERDAMLELIVRRDREAQVIELAETLANHYDLAPDAAVAVFRFMIETTVDIEIDYLRLRMTDEA